MSKAIKGKETQRAEISYSRSVKNPFKVKIIGENGEVLMTSELLSTKLNCKKNLLAAMRVFNSPSIIVDSIINGTRYKLWADGFEQLLQD